MPRPPRDALVAVTQPPISNLTEWDLTGVLDAVNSHELGYFQQSTYLAEWLFRDDRYHAVMGTLLKSLFGLPFRVDSATQKQSGKEQKVAGTLEGSWDDLFPQAVLAEILGHAVSLGVGLGEIVWQSSGGQWVPTLKAWHPSYLYWSWADRGYHLITEGGTIPVTPGDGKWFLFLPYGPRSWMWGTIRSLAIPVLMRNWSYRDWANYNQKHAMPVWEVDVPAGAATTDQSTFLGNANAIGRDEPAGQNYDYGSADDFWQSVRTLDSFKSNLSRLGTYTNALLCLQSLDGAGGSYGFKLHEPTGQTWQAIKEAQTAADVTIAVQILGQNLSSVVHGGSFAAARVHEQVRQDVIEFWAEALGSQLRAQVLRPWAYFNFGDGALAPWPVWDAQPPEDLQAQAQTFLVLGQALAAFAQTTSRVDLDALAERFDLPLLAKEVAPPLPAPAPTDPTEQDPAGLRVLSSSPYRRRKARRVYRLPGAVVPAA